MKLVINAQEVLALHNMLHKQFEYAAGPANGPDAALQQVYLRLRSIIIGGLQGKMTEDSDDLTVFQKWETKEQQKVDKLKEELVEVKQETMNVVGAGVVPRPALFGELDISLDEDYATPDYPRVGQRNRSDRKGNQKR